MLPLRDENPTRRTPVITVALIVLNVAVYFLVQPQGGGTELIEIDGRPAQISTDLRFHLEYAAIPCELVEGRPLELGEAQDTFAGGDATSCGDTGTPEVFPDKQVWLSVLFSMFLHGNLLHLAGNMWFLWIFGNNIEDHLGLVRYVIFYVLGGLAATAAHVALGPDSTVPIVGASGAIAGVMGAYLVWFPNAPITTAFFFVLVWFRRINAKWLLLFWLVSQFFITPDDGVAWVAHVGGFVFGALVALAVRASRAARRVVWTGDHVDRGPPPGGFRSPRW